MVFLMFLLVAVAPAAAQQVTGAPGSPSATTTIDAKQLPPPAPKFGGVIKESAKNSGIPVGNAPSILDRDHTITPVVTIPDGGAEGMIATLGGRFGGYGLYLSRTFNWWFQERFKWEGSALSAGKHAIVFNFKYDGPGPAKGGTGVLSVDGKEVDRKSIAYTIPLLMSIDETFDIGVDTRTSVDEFECRVPFRFTGKIDKLTYNLGPEQLSAEDKEAAAKILAAAKD
jgi:hypothetical protein